MSEKPPTQLLSAEINRRRFLTWAGLGAAAVAAGGVGAYRLLADEDGTVRRGAGENANARDEFPHTLLLSPAMAHLMRKHDKDLQKLSMVTPLGEFPLAAHSQDSWLRLQDTNVFAARLDKGHAERAFFVATPDLRQSANLLTVAGNAVPAAFYGPDEFGREQIYGLNILPPRAGHKAVYQAAVSANASLATLFAADSRLRAWDVAKSAAPASVEEMLAMTELSDQDLASAMSLLFLYPPTTNIHPTGSVSTVNIIYRLGLIPDLSAAINSFTSQGMPFGQMKTAIKSAVDEDSIVYETLDPRVGREDEEWDASLPEVPFDIGTQPAKMFIPFMLDGMKWGQPGLEVVIPPVMVDDFRTTFRRANVSVTNALADSGDVGVVLAADSPPTAGDLAGKTWQQFWDKPVAPLAVKETSPPPMVENDSTVGPVNFQIVNQVDGGGLHAEITDVTRETSGATTVTLRIYNSQVRNVAIGVQWFDGRNLPMQPPDDYVFADTVTNDWTWNMFEGSMISSVPLSMGMPIAGWSDKNYQDFELSFPVKGDKSQSKSGARCRVIAGAPGTNYQDWASLFTFLKLDAAGNEVVDENGKPIALQSYDVTLNDGQDFERPQWYQDAYHVTTMVNIALPILLLLVQGFFTAMGALSLKNAKTGSAVLKSKGEFDAWRKDFPNDPVVDQIGTWIDTQIGDFTVIETMTRKSNDGAKSLFNAIPLVGLVLGSMQGVAERKASAGNDGGWWNLLFQLPDLLFNMVAWPIFTHYFGKYLEALAVAETTKVIPIVGTIFVATSLAVDTAQITQAVTEVNTSPNTAWWEITGTYSVTLTLKPQLATFAPTAVSYFVEVLYDKQKSLQEMGDLSKDTKGYTAFPADNRYAKPDGFGVNLVPAPWTDSASYKKNDAVAYPDADGNQALYIALTDSKGAKPPASSSSWAPTDGLPNTDFPQQWQSSGKYAKYQAVQNSGGIWIATKDNPDQEAADNTDGWVSGGLGPTIVANRTAEFPAGGARKEALAVKIDGILFGSPVRFVVHIISADVWDVGTWTSPVYTNSDLNAVVTNVTGTVEEEGTKQSSSSRYERNGTSAVSKGGYVFSNDPVPGTIHNYPDIQPGSIVIGRGTGLASYVFQNNGKWFVRQLATNHENPSEGAAELARSWTGERPHIAVDQLAKLGEGRNWLLEPDADGYHVRSLNLAPKEFSFDSKRSYGRFLDFVTHMSMSPTGHLLGVSAASGKYSLVLPSQQAADPDSSRLPLAKYFAGPGNRDGSRPGLLQKPVGIVAAGNGVVAILEQGGQRIQAFNLRGLPLRAFQGFGENGLTGDADFYAPARGEGLLTYLDVTSDPSGFIFVLSYVDDGSREKDYVLDVFAPGSNSRLYRYSGFNSGKLVSDPFRNLYAANFQAITVPDGKAGKQPSMSLWIPRTPHPVKAKGRAGK